MQFHKYQLISINTQLLTELQTSQSRAGYTCGHPHLHSSDIHRVHTTTSSYPTGGLHDAPSGLSLGQEMTPYEVEPRFDVLCLKLYEIQFGSCLLTLSDFIDAQIMMLLISTNT